MRFWKDHASYPFQSHDLWFMTEDIRWGKFEAGYDAKALVAKVNREDLWKDAAKELGVAAADIPASKSRGKETFFDGKVFDPEIRRHTSSRCRSSASRSDPCALRTSGCEGAGHEQDVN